MLQPSAWREADRFRKRIAVGPGNVPMPSTEAVMRRREFAIGLKGPAALALLAFLFPREASANTFGHCARQKDLELKIAACTEASKSTSYPWVLRWVHRELARAHRERGEIALAHVNYQRSLAAHEDVAVRREIEELSHPLAAMPAIGLAGSAVAEGQLPAGHPASLVDIGALTVDSDFTVFMRQDVPEGLRQAALRRLWVLMELPVSCYELCAEPEPATSGFARLASESGRG